MFVAPEVAPSTLSSGPTDPQCTVVFDSAKVNESEVNGKKPVVMLKELPVLP